MTADIKKWKLEVLDAKSPSFCGAKWYNASMWLYDGTTTSCHHNPTHAIDVNEIKTNPRALHNTAIKKNERRMMQIGEKPKNCQFCWVMEEVDPTGLADRTWLSKQSTDEDLKIAFENSYNNDYDLNYLEIAFDQTCNLACSYCCPSISSTWTRDIKNNGPYTNLPTDHRQHYTMQHGSTHFYKYGDANPYIDAFFSWWEASLHKTLKRLRITGGEPMMSAHTWRLLDWLAAHPGKSQCVIEITTNLAYDDETLDKFFEKCRLSAMPISIYTSAECVGSKTEYVRDGFSWQQWTHNFDRVVESGLFRNINLCTTLSAISVDGFVDFLEWLLAYKKKLKPHNATIYGFTHTLAGFGSIWWELVSGNLEISVNPVRFPTFQNIVVLPKHMREEYSRKIIDFINRPIDDSELVPLRSGYTRPTEAEHWFAVHELDHIRRFANYLVEVKSPHQETSVTHNSDTYVNSPDFVADTLALSKDFKQFFTQYDHRRGKDFVNTFPNLKTWYESIQI